jgi:hypothetical protein
VTRPLVQDNVISDMTQGDGILIVGCSGGCDVLGGRIEMPVANDGTGVGGPALKGCGIQIENSSHVTVQSIEVVCNGAGDALFVSASGASTSDIAINGGTFTANGSATTWRADSAGAPTILRLSVNATRHISLNASAVAVQLAHIDGGMLTDAVVVGGCEPAMYVASCTGLRITGGSLSSTGPIIIRTAGRCIGSQMSRTVDLGAAVEAVDNAALAFQIEWTGNAPPSGGTWAVGDHVSRPL